MYSIKKTTLTFCTLNSLTIFDKNIKKLQTAKIRNKIKLIKNFLFSLNDGKNYICLKKTSHSIEKAFFPRQEKWGKHTTKTKKNVSKTK